MGRKQAESEMDDKKFESPEEVRTFLDSDAFAKGFNKWLVSQKDLIAEVSQHFQPLVYCPGSSCR